MKKLIINTTVSLLLICNVAQANMVQNVKQDIAQRWETIEFTLEKEAKLNAYAELSSQVELALEQSADSDADLLTWAGIVNASYAGAKGGLGALSLVKTAKKQLESALNIDSDAGQGGAMTTLGTLYAQVPGWPIAFGNDKKANKLLRSSAENHPDNLVAQYFYGKYLLDNKKTSQAKDVLIHAATIPPRAEALRSDSARLEEIRSILLSM